MKSCYRLTSVFVLIAVSLTAGYFARKASRIDFSGSVSELVVIEKSVSPLTDEAVLRGNDEIILTLSNETLFTVDGLKDLENMTKLLVQHKIEEPQKLPSVTDGKFLTSVLSAANSAVPKHRPHTERNQDRKNLIGCLYAIRLAEDTYLKYRDSGQGRLLFDMHKTPIFPKFPDNGLSKSIEYLSEDTFWLRAPQNTSELEDFRNDVNQSLFRRNLISADYRTAAIYLGLAPGVEKDMHSIIIRLKMTLAPFAEKYRFEFAGYPVLKEEVRQSIISDSKMFIVLALLFWTIAFWTCFRTLRGIILPLINLVISEICLLGIMAEAGLKLNAVLFIVPVFLVAVGSSGSIHMMTRFYKGIKNQLSNVHSSIAAVKELALPLFSSSLTTAFGFGMLMISNVKGLNQFALLCITGLVLNTVGTLIIIPAFNILLPSPRKAPFSEEANSARWEKFIRWIVKRRIVIIPVFAILSIVSVAGINFIIADNDLTRLLDRNSPQLKTLKTLSKDLGGMTILKLDICDPNGAIILKNSLASMRTLQQKITEIEGVDKVMSIIDLFDLLSSLRNYQAKTGNSDFQNQLTIDSHINFLEEMKGHAAFREHSAAINSMLRTFASIDYSTAVMTIQTSNMSLRGLNRIKSSILEEAGKLFRSPVTVTLRGEMLSINNAVERVIKGQTSGVIWSLITIFATMLFMFLSIKVAIIVMIPNLFPILFFYGYLGFSKIGLDLSSGLIACVAIGISVDNSIYFMTEMKRNLRNSYDTLMAMTKSAITVGNSMFSASLVLAFLFGVLWFSRFQVFSNLGFLQSQTMIVCLLANLLLLPAILATFQIVPIWDIIKSISSESLYHSALLANMSWLSKRIVISLGKLLEIKKGHDIIIPGQKVENMYMVIKGSVKIKSEDSPVEILMPGDVFSEETLIGEAKPSVFTAHTNSDVTLLEISHHLFDQAGWLYPITCGKLSRNIMKIKAIKSSHLHSHPEKEGIS